MVLIAGINGHICDRCIGQAHQIVADEFASKQSNSTAQGLRLHKPAQIKEFLDDFVIGQDDAKKVLAVAVYNHYKRLASGRSVHDEESVEVDKSNIVLVGQTGTGKTLLARTIAKLLNVPFCIADATVLTEAGYVGEDVESVLSRLLQNADYDTKQAERGIVFIDEIDKIARKGDNPSITRDVSGEGVQQGLLKLLEGAVVNVPPQGGRKHPEQKLVPVDTRNILFICGGAFDGRDKIIAKRLRRNTIGYSSQRDRADVTDHELLGHVSAQDLKTYGLIPELIGRLPVISHLDPLDADALRRILTEPKNALVKQYRKLFRMDGIELTLADDVLDLMVEKAMEFKLGARGLRSIMEAILLDAMYELPSGNEREIHITRDYAEEKMTRSKLGKLRAA
jgi:ATP-dependent Clp protease ATP-binding subunit ClpX